MTRLFYAKLAFNNIKKNKTLYFPYILTCIFTITMFYIIKSLSINPNVENMSGGSTVKYTLNLGMYITGLFSIIFLFYTHSYIIKKRQKEFGLLNILGLEKRNIGIVLAFETLFLTIMSIGIGLIFGILFDKLMLTLLASILKSNFGIGFFISPNAIINTLILFSLIFLFIFVWSYIKLRIVQPIELLKGSNVGEKEPKAKWLLAIIGVILIATGYVLAVTAKNGLSAFEMFFFAVILVILGTYCLFTTGSIALLKILKKNKNYYYKTRHFTGISGMIYRMKRNAVGLANICILSTFVIGMIATTSSFMMGQKEMIENRYPYEINLTFSGYREKNTALISDVHELAKEENISIDEEFSISYLAYTAVLKENDVLTSSPNVIDMGNLAQIVFITLDDYNAIMNQSVSLNENEILLCDKYIHFSYDTLKVYNKIFTVKNKVNEFIPEGVLSMSVIDDLYAVVQNQNIIEDICEHQKIAYGSSASEVRTFYGIDLKDDDKKQIEFYNSLEKLCKEKKYNVMLESRADGKSQFLGLYGGFFFIGIYLGSIFLMATILIIYYKQITEGIEDKDRFAIMQKVGMSYLEVKQSIRSQVLTVFFLPLILSCIHIIFAFPMINKVLALFNLTNTSLFAICTLCCFAVFTLIYIIVYLLTAKVYYRIVRHTIS